MARLSPNQFGIGIAALAGLLALVYFAALDGDDGPGQETAAGAGAPQSGVASPSADQPLASTVVSIEGSWVLTVDVTQTDGDCLGEEDEPPYQESIVINQMGAAIEVSGIAGAQAAWHGSFDGTILVFAGEKDDGSGVTKARFTLLYDPDNKTFTGQEDWTWSAAGESCSAGLSQVSAEPG